MFAWSRHAEKKGPTSGVCHRKLANHRFGLRRAVFGAGSDCHDTVRVDDIFDRPALLCEHIPVATSITLVMDVHRNAEDNITGKGLHAADVTDQITQHEFDRRCLPVELDTA